MSVVDAVLAAQLTKTPQAFSGFQGVTLGAAGASIVPMSMSRDGKELYGAGTNGTHVYRSRDDGATWQDFNINAGILPGFAAIKMVWPLDDGEILLSVLRGPTFTGEVWKSNGYASWAGGAASVSFNQVLVCSTTNCYIHAAWTQQPSGHIFTVAEYGPQGSARRVWLTRDFGNTFAQVFDIADANGGVMPSGDHVHGTAFDPVENRAWIVHGDQSPRVMWSDDYGTTWNVAVSGAAGKNQVVSILPLANGTIFGTDGAPYGVRRLRRGVSRYLSNPLLGRQTVTITGAPTGGTFTLTYGGQATAAIPFNETAANVATALNGLSSIGAGGVTVTGANGGPYVVTFKSGLYGVLSATGALTGGTTPAVGVAATQLSALSMETPFLLPGGGQGGRPYLAYTTARARNVAGAPIMCVVQPTQTNTSDRSRVVVSADGNVFYDAWVDTNNPGADKGMSTIVGPTATGKYFGSYVDAGGNRLWSATSGPKIPETPLAPS